MRPDHPSLLLPRASVVTRAEIVATPGFWCEWQHADGRLISSARCPTPGSAIRWARIQIRIIASVAGSDLIDPLVDRRYKGWSDAASALRQGADFTIRLTADAHAFEWRARPGIFVPLVDDGPPPHCPEGGHRWG